MKFHLQVGGALKKDALYAARPADKKLPEMLLSGDLCLVLAPSQMGKSSLRVHTQEKLRNEGVLCASIDLMSIGSSNITPEQWYFGLTQSIASELKLKDPDPFWKDNRSIPPVQRWLLFLQQKVIETSFKKRVVLLIDEINEVLNLPFSQDDFFHALQSIYDARATSEHWGRISFALFGVALPSELSDDPLSSPFLIGRPILLEDFTREELEQFSPAFEKLRDKDPQKILDAIFSWTSGHPYMTNCLCEAVSRQADPSRSEREIVKTAVDEEFLKNPERHFTIRSAEQWFEHHGKYTPLEIMFDLYDELLSKGVEQIRILDESQLAILRLKLSGIVAEKRDGKEAYLKIRNRIFATIFNERWLKFQERKYRRFQEDNTRTNYTGKNFSSDAAKNPIIVSTKGLLSSKKNAKPEELPVFDVDL
jgi:hypothetical protein